MKTQDAARGKWKQILPKYDIPPEFLDGAHHPCPCNGAGTDRFRFSDLGGYGRYFCACSGGEKGGFDLIECKTGKMFPQAATEIDAMLENEHEYIQRAETYAEKLRNVAVPSKRSAYLESRGLIVPPGLRFARDVEYFCEGKVVGRYDAMLAPITRGGKFLTYHVTYVKNGRKAPVTPCRKILPGPGVSGGGVELWPPASTCGVSEGIETAIAASMLSGMPVHAALNTGGMAKWEPPQVTDCVWIFADSDANFAGHKAAYTLAHRLMLMGIHTNVVFPTPGFNDFNDELLGKANVSDDVSGAVRAEDLETQADGVEENP
ncbi:MAG: toprim domain-containing protein [Candidatus Acidiferrales bacterium]